MSPLRVKMRRQSHADAGLRTPSPFRGRGTYDLPEIETDDPLRLVVKKLALYIADAVTLPSTFEQLRTTSAGEPIRALVQHLAIDCDNPAIVNALLALKWHYGTATEDKGLSEARSNACEIVAWRFLTHLSEREAVSYCLYEIPDLVEDVDDGCAVDEENGNGVNESDETTALLAQAWSHPGKQARRVMQSTGSSKRSKLINSISRLTMMSTTHGDDYDREEDPTSSFIGLNALEIAAIADAKRFLSQGIVQKIITSLWNGDIIFWDRLSVHSVKKPRFYNPNTADAFSRLRVPKYLKSFEVLFFAIFLILYYAVLVERDPSKISTVEVMLYIWFAAFSYDELSEWLDAGMFYSSDVWNIFDLTMIAIGFAFAILRVVGLSRNDPHLVDIAFDILSLEALFMVPRISSVLSLSPYWGTLVPCLKEMGKDFIKFMVLVIILYLGFLTTFALLARDQFTLPEITWVLTKIFFGSSYVGFDIMEQIDPIFGPPLMLIFVTLSSILLLGSLTGMLSNSFSRVISHAKEEYLFVYSVYVLEASTSNRLTHFYPPFNLLALIIFRPLRLFLPSGSKFRAARIVLLKATHVPIVGAILLYELIRGTVKYSDEFAGFKGPRQDAAVGAPGKSASAPSLHRSRPSSSSYRNAPRPVSASDLIPRLTSANGGPSTEEALEMDAPTDVEVRIAELSSKIDRLTELVMRLQAPVESQPENTQSQ